MADGNSAKKPAHGTDPYGRGLEGDSVVKFAHQSPGQFEDQLDPALIDEGSFINSVEELMIEFENFERTTSSESGEQIFPDI